MTMPTDDSRNPLMPVLPWQRPPVTRNLKGQWMPGVWGNPRGRDQRQSLRAVTYPMPSSDSEGRS